MTVTAEESIFVMIFSFSSLSLGSVVVVALSDLSSAAGTSFFSILSVSASDAEGAEASAGEETGGVVDAGPSIDPL